METAQWGWGDGPTADPNGFDVGTITKDPQGRLWSISGKVYGDSGRYWQQLTGPVEHGIKMPLVYLKMQR